MRVLLIGDIVGKPGRQIVVRAVPGLRIAEKLDLVVANAENAAGGSGLTPAIYQELIGGGVDCITMGDHIFRRREIYSVLENQERIVRPANLPDQAPGRRYTIVSARPPSRASWESGVGSWEATAGKCLEVPTADCQSPTPSPQLPTPNSQLPAPNSQLPTPNPQLRTRVAVFNLLGRIFMPPVDCPLQAADRVLAELPADVKLILLDYHAEATSDKQIMGRYLDGRVSAVLGTHTHVATADEQILPGGTAFQSDVGMTGPHESILGRRIDRVLETTRTSRPTHFEVARGDCRLHGTVVDIDNETGRAMAIRRLVVDQPGADRLAALARNEGVAVGDAVEDPNSAQAEG